MYRNRRSREIKKCKCAKINFPVRKVITTKILSFCITNRCIYRFYVVAFIVIVLIKKVVEKRAILSLCQRRPYICQLK